MASQRIPLVAGNWKMNFDHLEATYFVQQLAWNFVTFISTTAIVKSH